jgi:branched-chain amino acid transport system permease protein
MGGSSTLFQQFINGLTLGVVYALIAVGYTMVYGIIELINFAHGEVYMMTAFMTLTLYLSGGLPLIASILIAIAFASLLGVTIERVAYRPLRNSPRLVALISAIGVSLFLQNLAMKIWGARRQPLIPPDRNIPLLQSKTTISLPLIGEATFTTIQIIMLIIAVTLMILLSLIIKYTKMGRAMRACAQDQVSAKLMGVNVNRTIAFTFAIGSALGGVAGILIALYYNQVYPMMGYMSGLKAFTAAVLGGIGNVAGAFLGGIVLGVAEGFCGAYISSLWMDAIAFAILIIVLIYKPSGLLGKRIPRST